MIILYMCAIQRKTRRAERRHARRHVLIPSIKNMLKMAQNLSGFLKMKKRAWKAKIKNASKTAGTYQPFFDSVIDTLAGIMEMRDNALEKFEAEGGNTIVTHTNKGGSTNIVKNPALVVIMDCNTQALAYWRDLGLTPAGLKRINEAAMKEKKVSALAEALVSFDSEKI